MVQHFSTSLSRIFGTFVNDWNPRDMEGYVLAAIVNAIDAAESEYPEGSAEEVNLQRNYDYYLGVENHMDYDKWWGPPDHDRYLAVGSGVDTSRSFPTTRTSNLTVSILNVTTACSRAFLLAKNNSRTCIELISNGGASVGQPEEGYSVFSSCDYRCLNN